VLTSDFDYELPPERIAQVPLPRGDSRMLVLDRHDAARHARVRDLPAYLRPGDLLVLNDTRVIPARLFGRRGAAPSGTGGPGGRIEVFLLEKLSEQEWEALLRPGKRARPGSRIDFTDGLAAEVVGKGEEGRHRLRFSEPVEGHLDRLGHVPLPPYIQRPDTDEDRERYQTVYARWPGAVAAPTAGLHLSEELLAAMRAAGVEIATVTLHVGLGTFRPVAAERIEEHRMERERYAIDAAAAAAIAAARERARRGAGRLVAVGTTVVRTLEGAAAAHGGEVPAGEGATALFITPGFPFQAVDALLTNFHLPRSTLLMLVSAFAGRERVLAAYQEAIREGYRFYSYGDAMLVERAMRLARTAAP
jgi:S-adenosylmethionine:tRNA ribosyltransferase-isomerase